MVENGLCKQLCLRMYPELSKVVGVIELSYEPETAEFGSHNLRIPTVLERDHRVYSFLACGLTLFPMEESISVAISASSTDNYPEESIENTLDASDSVEIDQRGSYWSSKGESDPAVPETLIYKLVAKLIVISEIHVQPFQAYFQFGLPIYSAKAVRFCMGHLRSPHEMARTDESASGQRSVDDMFGWTYTSPKFPMAQASKLQKFRLPKPVLCVGGILKVELLGRVQKQEMDGLYYICVSHVEAIGRSLGPAFDVDVLDQSGRCTLKYYPEAGYRLSKDNREPEPSALQSFTPTVAHRSVRSWERVILHALLGDGVLTDYDDYDYDDDDFNGVLQDDYDDDDDDYDPDDDDSNDDDPDDDELNGNYYDSDE